MNTIIPKLAHLRIQEIQSIVWITNAYVNKNSTSFGNKNSNTVMMEPL